MRTLTDAWREVRHHRGRVVATLVAIALSVAFLAAITTFMSTESNALGSQQALPASRADVVVDVTHAEVAASTLSRAVAGTPGVQASEQVLTGSLELSLGEAHVYADAYALPADTFRWSRLTAGRWPSAASEIVLSHDVAHRLSARVGSVLVDAQQHRVTVSGLSDDVPGLGFSPVLISRQLAGAFDDAGAGSGVDAAQWVVRVAPGHTVGEVRQALQQRLQEWNRPVDDGSGHMVDGIAVRTWPMERAQQVQAATHGFDVVRMLLLAFAAIAAVVGIIIVSTTFTILLAQRRRQIGLMRAVGATGGQVRSRLLAEALLLGLVGSLAGVALGVAIAAIGAVVTHAWHFGLQLEPPTLAGEVLLGMAMTLVAALAPAWRATRVAPLEALRPVETPRGRRRARVLRTLLCALLVLVGVLGLAAGFASHHNAIVLSVAGALLLALGVLLAAPLYVPAILRLLGALVSPVGATARLAASNARRNPARAAATATALMLAVGLITTLQVGTASARSTLLQSLHDRYPVDVAVSAEPADDAHPASPALPASLLTQLGGVRNIDAQVRLEGGTLTGPEGPHLVLVWTPDLARIAGAPARPAPGHVLVSAEGGPSSHPTVILTPVGARSPGSPMPWTASNALPIGEVMIAPEDAARLLPHPSTVAVWMTMADRDAVADTTADVQHALTAASGVHGDTQYALDGSALESATINRVLSLLLTVVTALLGVAVLIALIGVGNTLGLSVIERRRESALLRAMGMQRRSLRVMLLWEALLLAGVGVLVGVVTGAVLGGLGMAAVVRQVNSPSVRLHLALDVTQLVGMVLVALLAAALASVLPGRRAASAPPVVALADD